MILSPHASTAVGAAFLGSLVEFVEALTIVLAVGTVRGWRGALLGTGAGVALLALIVTALGPALAALPLQPLQLLVGLLLLLFGFRWLRKAILRRAGVIPLHDEDLAFAREAAALRATGRPGAGRVDAIAVATSFKAVVLEGLEVVFIVIAVGAAGGMLVPASLGALAAALLVVLLGLVLHRPLTRVPKNLLKLVVGVMLGAFGLFWIGEGWGFAWPGADLAIPVLALILLGAALAAGAWLRGRARPAGEPA